MEKYLTIPSEIHNIDDLSLGERYTLALIYNLSRGRPCVMSNNHLSKELRTPIRTVISILKRLKEKGYINIKKPKTNRHEITVNLQGEKFSRCKNGIVQKLHGAKMAGHIVQKLHSNSAKMARYTVQKLHSNSAEIAHKNIYKIYKNNNYNIGAAEGGQVVDNSFNTLMQDYREKVKARGGSVSSSDIERVKALYNAYGYELAYRAVFEVYIQDDLKNFDLMNKYCVDWQKEEEKEKDKGAAANVG